MAIADFVSCDVSCMPNDVDCSCPLIKDSQHYGHTVTHSASYDDAQCVIYDAQCDFGNFEALADF